MNSAPFSSPRDQTPSSFAPPLGRLCESFGVVAAVLVDRDGETVDYAGITEPFDIKVAAAEFRLVLALTHRVGNTLMGTKQLMMRASAKSFAVFLLPEGYALVVQMRASCSRILPHALATAVQELCTEAGLA